MNNSDDPETDNRLERIFDGLIDVGGKSRKKEEKLDESEGYVVFLDVLGTTEMISREGQTAYIRLDNLFKEAQNILSTSDYNAIKNDTDFVAVFDNIVFAYRSTSFDIFMRMLAEFLICGLRSGIMMRGAVSYGEYFSIMGKNRSIITGEAYLNAYCLEERIANYPRIIFGKDFDFGSFEEKAEDRDGIFFLDLLKFGLLKKNELEEIINNLKVSMNKISEEMTSENQVKRLGAYGKYSWMVNYLKQGLSDD